MGPVIILVKNLFYREAQLGNDMEEWKCWEIYFKPLGLYVKDYKYCTVSHSQLNKGTDHCFICSTSLHTAPEDVILQIGAFAHVKQFALKMFA